MMFGQISGRDSLRDLLVSIVPHRAKYYHLGFGKNVTRSNLQLANERRDSRIFEEFAYAMIEKARSCATNDEDFKLEVAGPVYAIDSTLIDLCLNVFWWAGFRTAKGAVKIHTLMDVKTSIPCFLHITDGTVHDVNFLDLIKYENGGFYVLDRGYLDFERLFKITSASAYFVTRPRKKFDFTRISSRTASKKTGVLCDQTITLNNSIQQRSTLWHYVESDTMIKTQTNDSFLFLTTSNCWRKKSHCSTSTAGKLSCFLNGSNNI
jgi:hypothetical protein